MNRRSFLLAASSIVFAGCAAGGSAGSAGSGSPAPAPAWRAGDRWTYSAKDGYRNAVTWEETHEVLSVAAGAIEVRVTQRGPSVGSARTERLSAPGVVAVGAVFDDETRRFATPLERYRFPLTPGERWSQVSLQNFNEALGREDPVQRAVIVGDWTKVTTPAGEFDAITMRVFMQVNLNDPFNYPTQCNYEIWWAPAVGATVRETKYATYRQRGDGRAAFDFRAQNTELLLTSYRRAG